MKVIFDNKDIVNILKQIEDDVGAHLAAVEAVDNVQKLPWTASATYVEAMLCALQKFYNKKNKKKEPKK